MVFFEEYLKFQPSRAKVLLLIISRKGSLMKAAGSFLVLIFLVASASFAQDAAKEEKSGIQGYVVDAMCAKGMAKKESPMDAAAKHTKECALEEGCAASGFGVFSEGKWYKFDENGDKIAKNLIEKSKTEKGLIVEVAGDVKDNVLVVSSITEVVADDKKEDKKEAGHEHH